MANRNLDPSEVDVIKIVTLFSQEPATWAEDSCCFEGTLFRRKASCREECAIAFGAVLIEYERWGAVIFGDFFYDLAKMVEEVLVNREKVPKNSSIFDLEEWSVIRRHCSGLLADANVMPIHIRKSIKIEDKIELFSLRQ